MDIYSDFWKTNPEYTVVYDDEFVFMSDSSKIMWSIYMYYDPRSVLAMETNEDIKLEYIRKKFYPDFDPSDAYTETQAELYKKYIPEPETAYFDLLKQTMEMVELFRDIKPRDAKTDGAKIKEATAKVDGLMKASKLLDVLKAKRKELQESRLSGDGKGLAGYTPSRAEFGRMGSASR